LKRILFLLIFLWPISGLTQVTNEESREAARTIGTWLSESTGHYDFLSATPVGPKRAGKKFFIRGYPDMQTASDYGMSQSAIARDDEVTKAYQVLGFNTNNLQKTLTLNRFHLAWNFANRHDFSFSYLSSLDGIKGWGIGYKRVLLQTGVFYLSWRGQYGRAQLEDYFENINYAQDLSASLYLRLFDVYAGIKHSFGYTSFDSPVSQLEISRLYYSSNLNQLSPFYGFWIATSTNSRFSFQMNHLGEEYIYSGKFSLWFDALLPTANNWFRDPRYIKQ
jgi:hypothetical protein